MNFNLNAKKAGWILIASAIIGGIIAMFSYYFNITFSGMNVIESFNLSKIYFIVMGLISLPVIYFIWSLLEKEKVIQKKIPIKNKINRNKKKKILRKNIKK